MNKPTRQVYSNDRTAPRMKKAQFTTSVITKDLWIAFTKKHPEHKDMTWATFYKNWNDIAQTIRQETVSNPLGVKLGSYTGELKLQYLSPKFEAFDNKISEELGEKTKGLQILTRGKVGKLKWERRWAVKFNKMLQFFAFDEVREINVLAKKHIDNYPEAVRVARNTLGGFSVWRQIKNND